MDRKHKNATEAAHAGYDWHDAEPCEPTPFSPGTFEKLFVLRVRYWAGLELWHPDDGGGESEGTPLPV